MKYYFTVAAFLLTGILACTKDSIEMEQVNTRAGASAPGGTHPGSSWMRYSGPNYSQLITKDTANRMIQSYLNSIGYPGNDSTLRYLIFDADTMRRFLNDTSHGRIATVKLMLAHKLEYINGGKYGVDAHMRGSNVTLVMVGLNEEDEYIYCGNNQVYDNFGRCPDLCNVSGVVLQ